MNISVEGVIMNSPDERPISLTHKEAIDICCLLNEILAGQKCKCDAVKYQWLIEERIKESESE